jgi:hypothetical protein
MIINMFYIYQTKLILEKKLHRLLYARHIIEKIINIIYYLHF